MKNRRQDGNEMLYNHTTMFFIRMECVGVKGRECTLYVCLE